MKYFRSLIAGAVLLLLPAGYPAAAEDAEQPQDKEKFELSESEKKKYLSDATYQALATDPALYSAKDKYKRVFKAIYVSNSKELPAVYKDILPKSLGSIQIEEINAKLPIFFQQSKDKLRDEIVSLTGPKLITIYGTISSKAVRRSNISTPLHQRQKSEEKYYLMIDDISYENPVKSTGNNKFDVSQYLLVKYQRIDMQPQRFVEKKIRFDISFKEISNNIHPVIIKYAGLTPENFFLLNPQEKLTLPIIISRENEFCIEPLSSSKPGLKLNICGTVKSVKEETKGTAFNTYYIVTDGINEIIE